MADDSENEEGGNMMNYKGIYFNDDPNNKYTCPRTGAHFEFSDMCGRLGQVIKWRKVYEHKIAAYTMAGKGHEGIAHVLVHEDELVMTTKDKREQLRIEKEEFMRKMGVLNDKQSNNQVVKTKKKSMSQAAAPGAAHPHQATTHGQQPGGKAQAQMVKQQQQQQQQTSHLQVHPSQQANNGIAAGAMYRRQINHSQERVAEPHATKQIVIGGGSRTKQTMAQAIQDKRMKTSDSYEILTNQLNEHPTHLGSILTGDKPSKLSTKQKVRGLRDSQDSNQRSQVYIGEKNDSQLAQLKDASILTNYQQKQLQQLEHQSQATQQSSKSIKNMSQLRSKSIDKTSGHGMVGGQKYTQQQYMQHHIQQTAGQNMTKKQTSTMYNGLVQNGLLVNGSNAQRQKQQQQVYANNTSSNAQSSMPTTSHHNQASQKTSQLSAISSKRTNNQLRKRLTSDVQMIAIQQAKNNAMNTAEDSVSPHRPQPKLLQNGGSNMQQQMRIDSASRRTQDDIVKMIKKQPGAKGNPIGTSSKTRARPQYGLAQADSNFTGLYQNDLASAQYQRRVGTQDVRGGQESGGSFVKGLQQNNSYHQSINSNRNITSSNRSTRQQQRESSSKGARAQGHSNIISSGQKMTQQQLNTFYQQQQNLSQMSDGAGDQTNQTTIIASHPPSTFHGKKMSYKKTISGSQVPTQFSGQFIGNNNNQVPIRQLIPQEQHSVQSNNATGPKSRNPGAGKGRLQGGNSHGPGNKGSFGAMSSKSPVMAKSFAIPSNGSAQQYVNSTSVKGGKPGSLGYQKRISDFDNPLTSNTVDFTQLASNKSAQSNMPGAGNSQKDNQMLYKMMFQGGAGRQQKNLASSYLRGIDNQLRGNSNGAAQGQSQQQVNNNNVKQQVVKHGGNQSITNTGKRTLVNNKVVLAGIKMDGGSSRNKPMVGPSGTQKTRSFGNGKLMNGSLDMRKSYY